MPLTGWALVSRTWTEPVCNGITQRSDRRGGDNTQAGLFSGPA